MCAHTWHSENTFHQHSERQKVLSVLKATFMVIEILSLLLHRLFIFYGDVNRCANLPTRGSQGNNIGMSRTMINSAISSFTLHNIAPLIPLATHTNSTMGGQIITQLGERLSMISLKYCFDSDLPWLEKICYQQCNILDGEPRNGAIATFSRLSKGPLAPVLGRQLGKMQKKNIRYNNRCKSQIKISNICVNKKS